MKSLLLPTLVCLALMGCGTPETSTDTPATPAAADATAEPAAADATAEPAAPAATPAETADPESYGQYMSCKINGQAYLASYVDGHTSNISNPVNMASRTDFATSADQVPLNGDTKISELHLILFNLAKKRVGTYTSPKDFHLDGHTAFAKASGTGLDEYHFTLADGQTLTVKSLENGIVKGSFTADVMDDNDKSHVLHLTEGFFKLALDGGVKEISKKADGDVDLDKLMKDAMK